MQHLCPNKGPDGQPCGDDFNCRPCYLYRYHAAYNLLWGGGGNVEEAEGGVLNALAWHTRRDNPGMGAMVGNALAAAGRVVAAAFRGEAVIADAAEQERRLTICRTCDKYRDGRCAACGCFADLKTRVATESCPLGKW